MFIFKGVKIENTFIVISNKLYIMKRKFKQ